MKFNVTPIIRSPKKLEIDDDPKLRAYYDKRISQEVSFDALGDEFEDCVFKMKGGCDEEEFPMNAHEGQHRESAIPLQENGQGVPINAQEGRCRETVIPLQGNCLVEDLKRHIFKVMEGNDKRDLPIKLEVIKCLRKMEASRHK